MLKKHSILLGIIISIALLLIATCYYPGGSQANIQSVGYSWQNNYTSNLFAEKAMNGASNTARYWAMAGMMFLSISFALFFIQFSKKIPAKGAANIIKYFGALGMVFAFFIITPFHDVMISISSTMFLVGLFYITVFVLKSRLHVFKFLCIACLVAFYFAMYLYGSGSLRFLPVMQKVTFAITVIVIVGLQYFTNKEDFEHIKFGKSKRSE